MNIKRLPLINLVRHPARTAALVLLTAFLSFSLFGGTVVVSSLRQGLGSLTSRLGADIIVTPETAYVKKGIENILLYGNRTYFYMPRKRLDDVALHVEDGGVFVLPKPISPDLFFQAAKLLSASRRRISQIEEENRRLQQKLEETRTVGRAKCLLIERMHFTEQQAHRHIEKLAMDSRSSRRDVAESILRRYAD